MKTDVVNTSAQKIGDIELDDSVFAAHVKKWLFWEVTKAQLASRRAGTHSTKTVTMVQGSGKKPYRQKGTGRARHGTNYAVGMRGGGIAHGPHPRSYEQKPPKKVVAGALRSALSLRAGEQKLHVISGWKPSAPKTRIAQDILATFGADSALVVDSKENGALMKSLRNLPKAKFLPVEALNVYDILNHDHLFISDAVIEQITARLRTVPSRRDRERAAQAQGAQ